MHTKNIKAFESSKKGFASTPTHSYKEFFSFYSGFGI